MAGRSLADWLQRAGARCKPAPTRLPLSQRTEFGVVHVDTWSVQHGRTHERGEEVVLRIPVDARVVEK